MADTKIQDVNLIATAADTNKLPVSDGSGLAKTISVAQINGVHEAAYDHSTYLTETGADALYAPVLGADDNYMTDAEKTKLSGIADGAEVNVNADWNATSGDAQILNKPIIPSVSGLLDETAHDLLDHTGLTGIPSTAGLLDENAHDVLDHTGLPGIPAAYNLPTASTTVLGGVKIDGTTILISDGVISSTGGSGGGVTDHGLLTGLSDDDHSQYLNETRHTAITGNPHGTQWDQLGSTLTKLPLNTSLAAQALTAGEMAWNPDERCFDMGVNGVTLQAGQEQVVNVRNNTASTIPNGTVCMATGTIGASGRITVAPMVGSSASNAMYLIGIATEDIVAGADGFVTVFGKIRGLDTSAYVNGDILYTSTSTDGALTKVAPTTGLKQPIAFVVNAHSNGTLFVRIETLDHLAFQANGIIVTTGDGTSYLANDGTYKAVSSGVTDHGNLSGLSDDDHSQYLNETRHDLLDHSGITGIPSITGLLDETAHDLLDHTGLTGIPTAYTDEMAQDAVGAAIIAGAQTGITVTYDDANNKIDFNVSAQADIPYQNDAPTTPDVGDLWVDKDAVATTTIITVSTDSPSGGSDGDIWFKYST